MGRDAALQGDADVIPEPGERCDIGWRTCISCITSLHLPGDQEVPGDAIEKIGDEIVFDRAKVGFRRFKLKSVIFSIVLTLGCVLVNLFGPASRFDTCGDGACLQGNPFVFVLTVSMFYGLAYLCDVGLGMWVRAMWADMKGERY